ncbi:hypothetical protein KAFR_0B05200 [Kazachstania africana CBS 2517]|uniref:V-type proton ATPase subunit a n=1 Tax=Kazachstania africana (strain ATCC 22294 / BCRC 22015 / CBS 2517 / CECT 1963 / NBRC 1671 / NRRL Y-8276) TaxID=1071382 RepID=H2AR16_KAZAF|nr:hypothetical protein KAFR_0B05200 [Kazachstania africana CBS 2517]CCF56816.1 hypothetical protein KAFR_0B05200 [Kazachstania africana CBS 2517]
MVKEEAIFRSADMTYVELYIPLEISRDIVCLLGKLGLLMFRDMNTEINEFQRNYVLQLRKFDDLERVIQYLNEILSIHMHDYNITDTDSIDNTIDTLETHSLESITEIVNDITNMEVKIRRLDESLNDIKIKLSDLIEKRYIIFKCSKFLEINPGFARRISRDYTDMEHLDVDDFELNEDDVLSTNLSDTFSFDDGSNDALQGPDTETDIESNNIMTSSLHHRFMIIGSIERTKVEVLNKILWRLLRGNLFFQNFPIEEPLIQNNEKVEKDCFIVFTHGEILLNKIKRVVDSLNGKVISLDKRTFASIKELNTSITDLQQISESTERALHTELLIVNDQINLWHALVRREKYIYATLNLFRQESQGLIAEGWLPSSELIYLSDSLKDFLESIGSEYSAVVNVIRTNRSPPTYHKTNKFTGAFQAIVDAYGIATYKETNPGLATIVTFPFMFAIMFGDAGHGLILFIISLYLILNERKFNAMKRDEIFDMAFSGRYVLVLMGFFSIYTGLMYNDIFSKSMTLFKSGWEWPSKFKEGQLIEAKKIGVYSFGLDFAWHGTDNNLIFTNSYKMKLSILMGFIHMTYSYVFSFINYRFKNSKVDIIGNFIPGLIFMQSIFGYLSWAIIYKWSKDWIKDGKPAPGLLNMLINMFLSPGTIDGQLYRGQGPLQKFLLIAAFICVPWLLLYKPLTLRRLNNNALSRGYQSLRHQQVAEAQIITEQEYGEDDMVVTDYENDGGDGGDDEDSNAFNFGDIMIHQVIHTIEFCLNCISHTASYLRLWALSLAHAQLSTVLWSMTIQNAFTSENSGSPVSVIKVIVMFAMWFVLTVCILVVMEGTSAMLHALRLHWVEAMSKFFEGEGYGYEPFSFKNIIE